MGPWEQVDQTLNRFKHGAGSRRSLADTAYSSSENFHHRRTSDIFGRFAETVGGLNDAEKRKQKRMLVMQEIFEGSPEYQCPKCTELQTKYATDRKRFFLEAEHLRRGVQKLLDTCQSMMSASAFWVLKDSLQLGVRFFTEHTDRDVNSPRPAGDGGAVDSSDVQESRNPELENLLKENARLEEEVRRLERENAQLSKELATHQGKFLRASGSRTLARREDAAVQTDPMRFPKAKPRPDLALSDDDDDDDGKPAAAAGTVRHQLKRSRSQGARKRRSATGDDSDGTTGEAGGHSDDDHKPSGSSTGAAKQRQQAKTSKTKPEVPDQSKEIERLKDELELLRKKLKAAELLAEQAQKTVETVKVVTVEKVVKEERAKPVPVAGADVSEGIAPAAGDSANVGRADAPGRSAGSSSAGGGDSRGSRTSLAIPEDPDKPRRRSRSGQLARASTNRLGTVGKSGGNSGGGSEEAEGIPMGTAARVAAAVAAAEAKWKKEAAVKKDLVDACVGNGPGPGMQDEPVRCQGKQIKKPEELNKTGAVFQRTLRLGPDLGPSPFQGTAVASSSSTAIPEPKPNPGPAAAAAEPRPGKAASLGERKPSKPHGDAETHKGAAQPAAAATLRPTRSVSPEREMPPSRPRAGKSSPEQEQPRAPTTAPAQSITRAQATASAQATAPVRSPALAASTAPTQPSLEVEARAEARAELRAAEVRTGRTPASPTKPLATTWVGATSGPSKGLASTWAGVPTISENGPQPPPSAGAMDSDGGGAGTFVDAEPRVAKLASTLGAAPSGGSPRNIFRESRSVRQMARSSSATTRGSTAGEEPMTGTDTLREAEPYLLQVWDQRGQGTKKNLQSELMKLGALTPEPPKLPRTVSSTTLSAMLRE